MIPDSTVSYAVTVTHRSTISTLTLTTPINPNITHPNREENPLMQMAARLAEEFGTP